MKKGIIVFIVLGLISFFIAHMSFKNIDFDGLNIDKEDVTKLKDIFKIHISLNSLNIQKARLSEEESEKIYFQDYISSKNIKDIKIKTKATDIIFKKVTDKQIQTIFQGKISKIDKEFYPELVFNAENTTLNIEVKWPDDKRFVDNKKILVDTSLTVFLPQDIAFGIISSSTVHGNILTKDNIEIICNHSYNNTVSGDINIQKINSNTISGITNSGNINLMNSECDSLNLKSVSGDLICKEIHSKEIFSNTVSGYINIQNTNKKDRISADLKSVSGNILYNSFSELGNIGIKTTSGNSIIMLPKDSPYSFKTESLSGNISFNNDVNLHVDKKRKKYGQFKKDKADNYFLNIKSVSGDISINN